MNEPAATGIFRIGPVHQAGLPSTLAMLEAGIFWPFELDASRRVPAWHLDPLSLPAKERGAYRSRYPGPAEQALYRSSILHPSTAYFFLTLAHDRYDSADV